MVSVPYEQVGGRIGNAIAKRASSAYQTTIVVKSRQYVSCESKQEFCIKGAYKSRVAAVVALA